MERVRSMAMVAGAGTTIRIGAEAPGDWTIPLGDVRAELEHALGGDGLDAIGKVRKARHRSAVGSVRRADLFGEATWVVDDVEPVPLVRPGDDPDAKVVLGPRV